MLLKEVIDIVSCRIQIAGTFGRESLPTKLACPTDKVQDGDQNISINLHQERGHDVFSRSEGCIFPDLDPSAFEMVSLVCCHENDDSI